MCKTCRIWIRVWIGIKWVVRSGSASQRCRSTSPATSGVEFWMTSYVSFRVWCLMAYAAAPLCSLTIWRSILSAPSASVFPGTPSADPGFQPQIWGMALQTEKPTTLVPSASVFPGRYPQSVSADPGFQPQIWGTALQKEKCTSTTLVRYRLLLYSQVHPVGQCWSRLSASNLGNGITERNLLPWYRLLLYSQVSPVGRPGSRLPA